MRRLINTFLFVLLLFANSCIDRDWEDVCEGDYSSYLKHDYDKMCRILDNYVKDSCVFVGFITDLHYSSKGSGYRETVLRRGVFNALHVLRDLTERYNFSLVVMGGDYIQLQSPSSGRQTYQQGVDCVKDAVNFSKVMQAPTFLLRGNHEVNYYGGSTGYGMTAADFYNCATIGASDEFVLDGQNNWAYYDDENSYMRYVFLDVVDTIVREKQYKWLQQTVLKTIPKDFSVMFFSHVPLANMGDRKGNLCYRYLIDQTKRGGHDIVACVSGHIHSDWHCVENGVLYTTTLQAGFLTSKESEDGILYEHRKKCSEESAFDVLAIDKKNRKIHFVRFGLGNDREYDY